MDQLKLKVKIPKKYKSALQARFNLKTGKCPLCDDYLINDYGKIVCSTECPFKRFYDGSYNSAGCAQWIVLVCEKEPRFNMGKYGIIILRRGGSSDLKAFKTKARRLIEWQ